MESEQYKPGDLPPERYLDWHEWADVQRKAGIKQIQCGKCGKWRTPQELNATVCELFCGEKSTFKGIPKDSGPITKALAFNPVAGNVYRTEMMRSDYA